MKKVVLVLMSTLLCLGIFGCSSEDEDEFNYDLDLLYGKWRITHVMQSSGSYYDVTTYYAENYVMEPTYATFKSDKTYYGEGYFGNGHGTYTAIAKTITCYINNEVYMTYDVININNTTCELNMKKDNESIKIKCKKQ